MEIKILEERTNPLLKRHELTFEVAHATAATPTRDSVRTELAKAVHAPKDRVIIERMKPRFGTAVTRGQANVYDSAEAAKSITREHILVRNGLKEKEAKAAAAAPAATPTPAAAEAPRSEPAAATAPVAAPEAPGSSETEGPPAPPAAHPKEAAHPRAVGHAKEGAAAQEEAPTKGSGASKAPSGGEAPVTEEPKRAKAHPKKE